MMPKGKKWFHKGNPRCLWGHQMSRLNIFGCIECDLICSHNTRCKRSTALMSISHLSIKYKTHGVF